MNLKFKKAIDALHDLLTSKDLESEDVAKVAQALTTIVDIHFSYIEREPTK